MQVQFEKEFGVDGKDYIGVDTDINLYFAAGFEVAPDVETANDVLGFQFEFEAGAEVFERGVIMAPWITYVKADDYNSDPVSVSCVVKIGDPYTAEVQTFQGTNSMSSTSSKVSGRTFDQQNSEDRAALKDSFGTVQDLAWYVPYDADGTGERMIQPCIATIENDGKYDASSDIFGTYNITLGMRIYANETDTEPKALPDQSFQADFTMYETDLSNIYEVKDVPEDKSAEVIYMDEKFRRKIDTGIDFGDFTPYSGDEKFYWLRVVGGYKVFESGADDKFFFQMSVELPEGFYTSGDIYQFWLTYLDPEGEESGAVVCKIEIDAPANTETQQWNSEVNLSKDEVAGKLWYKQKEGDGSGKMSEKNKDIYARSYDTDLFSLQEKIRKGFNYKVQKCEVEFDIAVKRTTKTFEMQTGLRIYESIDSTTFITTREPSFDYYRKELEFSTELKEEPVYEAPQKEKQAEEKFEIVVEDVLNEHMDRYTAYKEQLAAEAEAAAAEDTTTDTTTDDTT